MRLAILIAALAVLAACGDTTEPAAATVNGDAILVSDVNDALARFEETAQFDQLAQQSDPQSARRQYEQLYLSQRIRRAVLRPEARELGIEVTDDEVAGQLEQIKANFPSEKAFARAVEERGFTAAEVEELIRDQLIEQELRAEVTADAGPTQQELEDYYASHQADYRQTRVQHILVQEQATARALSERLQAAPPAKVDQLFARLASQSSEDPSNAEDAGRLGWVGGGELVAPFEQAMNELAINEVSDPVRTEFGVHVIRVTGRRRQPFRMVSDEIEALLTGNAAEATYREWLADAIREADVEVNPRYGELDPVTGQVVNATSEDVPGAAGSSSPEGSSG
jgi:parvulin-like peptidyl-prolyl isomerase